MSRDPLLAVIFGPTASGKTSLSLAAAARFQGEIVNCDSVALYREFSIGTAKPTPEEQVRAPHHLLDIISPTDYTTAGDYARRARITIDEIRDRGHLPIVVGGTGLYLRALLEGLFAGPARSDELRGRLRTLAAKKGLGHLHRILARLDRNAAIRIHANDVAKVIRAVEACLAARQPITEQWAAGRDPIQGYRVLRIGLLPDRARLYSRINARVDQMFADGLVAETQALLEKYGPAARPLTSIGYRQVVQMLQGQLTREGAITAVQQAHRNYAKRQMTWFRREPEVHWLPGFGDDPDMQRRTITLIEQNL